MNERIKELAQQAGFEYDTRDCNFYHSYPAEQLNSNINNFAELIVRECVYRIDKMIDHGWYADTDELLKFWGLERSQE